jgi:hypothetical protein
MTEMAGEEEQGMESAHVEAVHYAASRFRTALERGGLSLPILAKFPEGSCGAASGLLGQYLIDSGLGEWRYRMGFQCDSLASHAWLERGGLTLDITADQFPDIADPVVLTATPLWHQANFITSGGGHLASLDWYKSCDTFTAVMADYGTLKRRADGDMPRSRSSMGMALAPFLGPCRAGSRPFGRIGSYVTR